MSQAEAKTAAVAAGAIAAAVVTLAATYRLMSSNKGNSVVDDKNGGSDDDNIRYLLLAGDIGGTNSRLGIYDDCDGCGAGTRTEPKFYREYLNSKYILNQSHRFEKEIVHRFLSEYFKSEEGQTSNTTVKIVACFACAGPVSKNRVSMTNVGPQHPSDNPQPKENAVEEGKEGTPSPGPLTELVIDGSVMEASTDGHLSSIVLCKIVNDFVGQGYGALDLDLTKEVKELTPGSIGMIDPLGPKVCVGAGTGLGECYLTISSHDPDIGYECYPSEGGHIDYSPRSDLEANFHKFLKIKFEASHRVSVERVVSGKGLANIYEFLSETYPELVDKPVHQEFLEAGDMQGKVVGVNARPGSLCLEAIEIMMSTYGAEVGSAALKWIPTGGLYVTGGLTPKNIQHIEKSDSKFMTAYHDKGRVKGVLQTIPLFAVMVEDLGLRGARVCAQREFNNYVKKLG